eukprot:5487115-Pleurochrysis_carterae.AAC.2
MTLPSMMMFGRGKSISFRERVYGVLPCKQERTYLLQVKLSGSASGEADALQNASGTGLLDALSSSHGDGPATMAAAVAAARVCEQRKPEKNE